LAAIDKAFRIARAERDVAGGVLVGREGATIALVLGAAFAVLGCVMSSLRLIVGTK
jgi:hypothetical protein